MEGSYSPKQERIDLYKNPKLIGKDSSGHSYKVGRDDSGLFVVKTDKNGPRNKMIDGKFTSFDRAEAKVKAYLADGGDSIPPATNQPAGLINRMNGTEGPMLKYMYEKNVELEFKIKKLSDKLKKVASDMDIRDKSLEASKIENDTLRDIAEELRVEVDLLKESLAKKGKTKKSKND